MSTGARSRRSGRAAGDVTRKNSAADNALGMATGKAGRKAALRSAGDTARQNPSFERLSIGEAARLSGVSVRMARHYESLGLLPNVPRTEAGYRQYGEREVHTLAFIRRARELGFSMAEIGELLTLWQDRERASASVKRIALAHVADLERRMAQMADMKRTLLSLAHACHGDARPDCPILEELGSPPGALANRSP